MTNLQNILVTTAHKGVFAAQVEEGRDLTPTTLTNLKNAKMIIRWRNTQGLQGICKDGVNDSCLISKASDIHVLHNVTAVFSITPTAASTIWE